MNADNKLMSIFGSIEDLRSHINKLHNLVDILLIGIISVISGAETWKQMVEFANSKEEFLKKFLILPNGIPSEDIRNKVFSSIDSSQFETCFIDWVNSISKISETVTDTDIGNGRIETRKCSVISDFQFIKNESNKWNNLKQIVKIESIREFKNSDKKTEKATRYYISSLEDKAVNYQEHIRSHWGVENKLHWTLDVAFSEDASRKRNKNAAQNYSILLKIVLNLLKNEKKEKQGIAGKRLKAGWNEPYLLKVLNIKV